MKYDALYKDLFSVFASSGWQAENIKTFPENYVGDGGTEYIRVTPLMSEEPLNNQSVSGLIHIEIFVPAGEGPARARQIADRLESHLAGKAVSLSSGRVTQFFSSNLSKLGSDPANPALYRMLYSLPFKHYGA